MNQLQQAVTEKSSTKFTEFFTHKELTLWECLTDLINHPVVVHLGHNFPGADVLVFEKINNESTMTLVQLRYSKPKANNHLTTADVIDILTKIRTAWSPHVDDPLKLLPTPVQYLPQQEPQQQQQLVTKLPFGPLGIMKVENVKAKIIKVGHVVKYQPRSSSVLIYNEEDLEKMYGPSLWTLVRPGL